MGRNPGQTDVKSLQAAHQNGDRQYQQEPIDPISGPLTAVAPELHVPETTAVATGQPQPAHLTAHRRSGAVDPGVDLQPHHTDRADLTAEPGEQLSAGESAIGQECDGSEPGHKLIGLLQ